MKRLMMCMVLVSALVTIFATAAAADPPTVGEFEVTFEDENPCTGEQDTVTITARFLEHLHGDRFVAHGELTTSTSSGFVGRGTTTNVENGRSVVFVQRQMLSNDAGERLRNLVVFVLDVRSDTVRVEKIELTCLGT